MAGVGSVSWVVVCGTNHGRSIRAASEKMLAKGSVVRGVFRDHVVIATIAIIIVVGAITGRS